MTLTKDLIQALEEEPSLARLVSQSPIAFHRSFVDITGSALSALMLSSLLELQEHAPHSNDWFVYDPHSIKTTTGLSRNEQKAANKVLREKFILLERKNVSTADWEIKLDFERITMALIVAARASLRTPSKNTTPH
ncbi:hypothetical protein [Limnohabitans sp.]|uniref:hypothetical protein n=1 Tax=Limnohabitans sp. TaxID=1907725 RepID=UPI00286FAA71|nr:hypothetical protein [Limnohabitans sp.]